MTPTLVKLKVARLLPQAKLPTQAHANDLGWDLYAAEAYSIAPGKMARLRTGIAVEFPEWTGGIVKDRSSMAAKGLHCLAGVIDPGYRGEIQIVCVNLGQAPIEIANGDRCAQMLLFNAQPAQIAEALTLADSKRGDGGFGSTGR